MFGKIAQGQDSPKYISHDNDPLFRFFRWKRKLALLEIEPIKSIAECPVSHPFIERLIRTVREEGGVP